MKNELICLYTMCMADTPDSIEVIKDNTAENSPIKGSEYRNHFRKKMDEWMSYMRNLSDKQKEQQEDPDGIKVA